MAEKAKKTGKATYNKATEAGQDAVDTTKEYAASLGEAIKEYLQWGKNKATDLQNSAKRTSAVGSHALQPCLQMLHAYSVVMMLSFSPQPLWTGLKLNCARQGCQTWASGMWGDRLGVMQECLVATQDLTKTASEKVTAAKDTTKDASKSAYDSVGDRLASMHDSASKQLEEARLTAEQQWAKAKQMWDAAPKDNRSMAQKQWDKAQV